MRRPQWAGGWLSAGRGRQALTGVALLTLGLLPVLVYRPVLGDFFALDDFIWLAEARNPDVGDFLRQSLAFGPAGADVIRTPFWRPFVDGYFFVAWRLFGLSPLPYHLVNAALHGLVAVLLARLTRRLTGSWWAGLVAGALFAVLPTYDFAVGWISNVTELLGACWYLLALTCYADFLQDGRRRRLAYAAALTAFALGLLTKESTATLPAALAAVNLTLDRPTSRARWLRHTRALAPFVLLTAAYGMLLYWQEYRASAEAGLYRFDYHALANIWDYVQRLALPVRDTDPNLVRPRQALALAFVAGGVLALVRRQRVLGFAFVWMFVALLPYSFFVAGIEYRYTYLATLPWTLYWVQAGRLALARLGSRGAGRVVAMPAALLIIALAVSLAAETRQRQGWLSAQARAYAQLLDDVPARCGALTSGGDIYLIDAPVWDVYGASSQAALTFRYATPRVHSGRAGDDPALTRGSAMCALRYSDGHYARVAP